MATGYETYFTEAQRILGKIRETQGPNIEKAASLIADAIRNDGVVQIFGAGHSNLLAEEIFYRAGTLAPVNHIVDISIAGAVGVTKSEFMERLEGLGKVIYDHVRPKPQDVFVIISNSGRNAAPVELAQQAQEHGHKVIALTSVTYSTAQPSRHSSGKRLLDYADVVLDNCGLFGDVCVDVPGFERRVGPTSGVAGAFILHATMVQAVFRLVELGVDPPVFVSGNLDGGRDRNQHLLDRYWARIRNW